MHIFFSYILWPEHKISNGACGVLEHYCSCYSTSITWCAMCVYACVFIPLVLLSCPCIFSHCLSPRIPWPIYTQLRAYWVWATCTNDWKHSRLKPGINPPVLQVKSTNHWYTQPKMFNAYFWNFAELNILMTTDIFMKLDTHMNDTVTVCLTLLWKITLSFSPFFIVSHFQNYTLSSLECCHKHLFRTGVWECSKKQGIFLAIRPHAWAFWSKFLRKLGIEHYHKL